MRAQKNYQKIKKGSVPTEQSVGFFIVKENFV